MGKRSNQPPRRRITSLDREVLERLLRDTDAASMASSLEVRVPLIDHELLEVVAGLPHDVRFDPNEKKRALRLAAMPDLPTSIFDRPKSGFVLPIDAWCRSQLGTQVADLLHDHGTPGRIGRRDLGRKRCRQQRGDEGQCSRSTHRSGHPSARHPAMHLAPRQTEQQCRGDHDVANIPGHQSAGQVAAKRHAHDLDGFLEPG